MAFYILILRFYRGFYLQKDILHAPVKVQKNKMAVFFYYFCALINSYDRQDS